MRLQTSDTSTRCGANDKLSFLGTVEATHGRAYTGIRHVILMYSNHKQSGVSDIEFAIPLRKNCRVLFSHALRARSTEVPGTTSRRHDDALSGLALNKKMVAAASLPKW